MEQPVDPLHPLYTEADIECNIVAIAAQTITRDDASTDARITVATAFKNFAIKQMAAKNADMLGEFLGNLGKWKPCAVSLRQSGLPPIFNDITICDNANTTEEVSTMRTKFNKALRRNRRGSNSYKTDLLAPFTSMSPFQFKQTVDSMEAFIQGGMHHTCRNKLLQTPRIPLRYEKLHRATVKNRQHLLTTKNVHEEFQRQSK